MQQRWWIAVVAVVGVGLAIMLFPRPNTGDGVGTEPGAAPEFQERTNGTAAVNPNVAGNRGRVSAPPGADLSAPGEAEQIAKRSTPESVYASKLVSPFSAIRYTLAKKETPDAKGLIDEIGALMTDLRQVRNDPSAEAWKGLIAKTDAVMAKVQASPWASDENIAKAGERYKAFLAEYEVAKTAAAQNPAPAQTPAPGEEAQ